MVSQCKFYIASGVNNLEKVLMYLSILLLLLMPLIGGALPMMYVEYKLRNYNIKNDLLIKDTAISCVGYVVYMVYTLIQYTLILKCLNE